VYGYSTNKVFIPLFLLVFFMLNRQWVKNNIRIFTKGLVVFLVTISPLVYLNLSQYLAQQGRFNEISIVNYRHLAPLLFVMQYMLFFTYDFFFPSTKELLNLGMIPATFSKIYFFELIFLVLGVFFIYKSRDKKNRDIILAWLLLYPIPAALTAGGVTHVFRANTAIPVFEIIIAYGIIQVIKKVREAAPNIFKKTMIAFSILALMEVTLFLSYFFFKYPLDSAKHFEYGHKDAFRYTESTQISNNGIVITNKSEVPGIIAQNFIFVLVYLDYSPTKFQTLKIEKTETNKDGWLILKSFDKYSFGDVEKEYNKNPNRVFIVREDELTKIPSKKEVYFPNGEIAFRIIYNEQ